MSKEGVDIVVSHSLLLGHQREGEESEPQRLILRTTCSWFNSIILFSRRAETIIWLVIAVHFTGNVSAAILHINYSNVWDSVARKLKRVMRRG